MIAGVILAAGESRRMGFPKPLLPYKGTTFLGHLLDVMKDQVAPLIVVLGHHAERIPIPSFAQTVINPNYHLGQLSSLQSAICNLKSAILVALVDHPCIERSLVATLIAAYKKDRPRVLIPTYHGRRGHPMIFSQELIPELLAAPLDEGARAVVRRHQAMELPVDDEGILLDLDDPESYRRVTGNPVPSA